MASSPPSASNSRRSSTNIDSGLGVSLASTSGRHHLASLASTSAHNPHQQLLAVLGPGTHVVFCNQLVVHKTIRAGDRTPWVSSFLFCSGVTALGLAAYDRTTRPYVELARPAAAAGGGQEEACTASSVPTALDGLTNVSLHHSLFNWPWRSASASSAGAGDLVLSQRLPQQLPELSRPPLLPPPPTASPLSGSSAGEPSSSSPAAPLPLTRTSISEAAACVAPAVVHLVVVGPSGNGNGADAGGGAAGTSGMGGAAAASPLLGGAARSSGTGIIYDSAGYILTNAHVVEGAAGDKLPLMATMQDGRVFRGRVINMDRAADVAVIKVDSPQPLPAASFGSSAELRVGAWVVALGSPLMLRHSVTAGIVSCVERRGVELGLSSARTGYIQTDAAINQGNSGGPLCNLDGEVVGINNMKAVAADGVSFAIPTDAVREIVRQFHLHGRVIRPYIGISMLEVANGGLKQLKERVPGLPLTSQSAVVIQRVVDGSPAMDAGLEAEDLLLSVAGEQNLSMSQVIQKFSSSIGKSIEVQVLRRNEAGEYKTLTRHLVPLEAPQQPWQ